MIYHFFDSPKAMTHARHEWPPYPRSGLSRNGGPLASCYAVTNENLATYLTCLPLAGADVLTVAGSGDHLLNSFALGAKHVDTFDHNLMAGALLELKLAAFMELQRQQFLDFFLRPSEGAPGLALHYRTYKRLRGRLSSMAVALLDGAYQWCGRQGSLLRESEVFKKQHDSNELTVIRNLYMHSGEHFERSRARLADALAPAFFHRDIKELIELPRSYDVILLSNITEYAGYMYDRDDQPFDVFCTEILIRLSEFCKSSGVIASCVFNPSKLTKNRIVPVRDPCIRRRALSRAGLRFEEFSIDGLIPGRKDTLLVICR